MIDKLCKDCVNQDQRGLCVFEYTFPHSGKPAPKMDCFGARTRECYCGAEGKHFEAKVEYITLDKIWKKWEKEGVPEKDFKKVFCRIGECDEDGSWVGVMDCSNCWGFYNSYSHYRIPKDKVPEMPEIVIPDCPHCGGKGYIKNGNMPTGNYAWCCKANCFTFMWRNTPRQAIALFHKCIKTER